MSDATHTATFRCVVEGAPVPWQRARAHGRRRFKSKVWERYEREVQVTMLAALGAGRSRPLWPAGPVELVVVAYWPMRGKARVRAPRPATWKATRPDGDNVLKGIADASQGFLVADDGQYVRKVVETWHAAQGEGARVEISARALEGAA